MWTKFDRSGSRKGQLVVIWRLRALTTGRCHETKNAHAHSFIRMRACEHVYTACFVHMRACRCACVHADMPPERGPHNLAGYRTLCGRGVGYRTMCGVRVCQSGGVPQCVCVCVCYLGCWGWTPGHDDPSVACEHVCVSSRSAACSPRARPWPGPQPAHTQARSRPPCRTVGALPVAK